MKIPELKTFKLKQQDGTEFMLVVGDVDGCKSPEPYINVLEGFFIEDAKDFFRVVEEAKELYNKVLAAKDLVYECKKCGRGFHKKDLVYSDTDLWCPSCNHSDLKLKVIIS